MIRVGDTDPGVVVAEFGQGAETLQGGDVRVCAGAVELAATKFLAVGGFKEGFASDGGGVSVGAGWARGEAVARGGDGDEKTDPTLAGAEGPGIEGELLALITCEEDHW